MAFSDHNYSENSILESIVLDFRKYH